MTLTEIIDRLRANALLSDRDALAYAHDGPIVDVLLACDAAQRAHGDLPTSAHQRLSILTEEVGEAAQAMNRHTWEAPCAAEVRAELVQVTATALRMIAAHDRLTITPTE